MNTRFKTTYKHKQGNASAKEMDEFFFSDYQSFNRDDALRYGYFEFPFNKKSPQLYVGISL